MCVAFIKLFSNGLILGLNRDEFYSRNSVTMQFDDNTKIYAGRDELKGGTWFALNLKAEFSFVTNIRNKSLYKENVISRGLIPEKSLENERLSFSEYNPFNLIKGSRDSIEYVNSVHLARTIITDKVIGLSNGIYPCSWPKVEKGKSLFSHLEPDKNIESLKNDVLKIMQDDEHFNFVVEGTGFSEEQEKMLTPIFIKTPEYGTVSTTVLIIKESLVYIHEENYQNNNTFTDMFSL